MRSDQTLVIDDLRRIAEAPNSMDRQILLRIQEDIAVMVIKTYRQDLVSLIQRQQERGLSQAESIAERDAFLAQRMNQEYRNLAGNGRGFSLPLYVEYAENYYKLEVRKLLQKVQDFTAQGQMLAEVHMDSVPRSLRAKDPNLDDLSHKVALELNRVNDAMDKLSRIRTQAAQQLTRELMTEMTKGLDAVGNQNGFASAMMDEVKTLAEVQQVLKRLGGADAQENSSHRFKP